MPGLMMDGGWRQKLASHRLGQARGRHAAERWPAAVAAKL
jgi:hypothetical protein